MRRRVILRLHRPWLHRVSRGRCPICSWAWRKLMSDPETVRRLEQGTADLAAGRWFRLERDGTLTPNPDWPQDGPQP